MKKLIKNPDGTETVFEGTPEEIAELERRLREEPARPTSGKKRLLHEGETYELAGCDCRYCELVRGIRELLAKSPPLPQIPELPVLPVIPPSPDWTWPYPIWVSPLHSFPQRVLPPDPYVADRTGLTPYSFPTTVITCDQSKVS